MGGKRRFRLFQRYSPQQKDLAPRQRARLQLHGLLPHAQRLGQKRNQRLVGAAFRRRRVHGNLQLRRRTLAINPRDGRLLCAGLRANGQRHSFNGRPQHQAVSPFAVRAPNSAVPTRMRVAPSSIASTKSSLMPIESVSIEILGYAAAQRSLHSRNPRKQARVSASATFSGAIVISPRTCRFSKSGSRSSSPAASADSGSNPALLSSALRFTSLSTGCRLASLPAASFSLSASRSESNESTPSNNSTARAALFDCRCPIR